MTSIATPTAIGSIPTPSRRTAPSWGMFAELDERARGDLSRSSRRSRQMRPAGSPQQKMRDFYRSYVDTDTIERAGLTPAQPALQAIESAHTYEELARLIGRPRPGSAKRPSGLYQHRSEESRPLHRRSSRRAAWHARSRLLPEGRAGVRHAARRSTSRTCSAC